MNTDFSQKQANFMKYTASDEHMARDFTRKLKASLKYGNIQSTLYYLQIIFRL